ncbi:MAG: 30S ribosome-binding factor RbfA [Muribaculaceae bacterium]|nr:30S ribosome-binding factor RbfA [Muribaculaceae bacterium]MDE5934237.1 30S ribosome-binding factor RbfA [Muribaculaceae bacterium]MDE6093825.1 30S ribosome-binding factor RbfA [Muribaculaceae bacterium]MDE6344580.1 30S ribosome-binding factor RbfA [Muribaculaceae bacterium]MDE6610580.1 30S ribosome-binding factor RbfA [Muribaculaceae bacterium]
METTRQAKISRLLQKELSEIFRKQTAKTRGSIVTVTTVRVSPDLSIAKAYISVFPSDKSEAVLESIRKSAQTIRYELAQIVRFQLRKTPELSFFLDDSMDYIENIDALLGKPRHTDPEDSAK